MERPSIFSASLESKYIDKTLWTKIESLSFQLIIDRMIIKHGWSAERTYNAIANYRRFLYLSKTLNEPITPTFEVDAIWHEHILHTNKYCLDCQKIFGGYLHHFPTPAKWKIEEKETALDIEQEFADCEEVGTNCTNVPADCSCSCSAKRTQDFDNPVFEMGEKKAVVYTKLKEEFFV